MTPFSGALAPGWRHPEPIFGERFSGESADAAWKSCSEMGVSLDDLTGESWGGGGSI
jgi:hypothetical protein